MDGQSDTDKLSLFINCETIKNWTVYQRKRLSKCWFCRITGVDGFISVDGRERNLNEFRRMSCYIQQDDRLQPLLTTWECMMIAADLKLPDDTKPEQKREIVGSWKVDNFDYIPKFLRSIISWKL